LHEQQRYDDPRGRVFDRIAETISRTYGKNVRMKSHGVLSTSAHIGTLDETEQED